MRRVLIFLVGISSLFFVTTSKSYADETCACQPPIPEYSIDELLACFQDTRCKNNQLDFKISLRSKGRNLADSIKNYMLLVNNPILDQNEYSAYLDKIKKGRRQLLALEKSIDFSGYDKLIEPVYIDYDNPEKSYHRHHYTFNLGYEYVSLDTIFQTGVPRIGFYHYRRYGDTPSVNEGLDYYGLHVFGSIQLTSSGEVDTTVSDEVTNTLQLSGGMFVPLFHSAIRLDKSLSDFLGPILKVSIKKNETDDQAKSTVYGGFRDAINPETYFEILYGRTQGLHSNRLEIGIQMPIYKFGHGTRIFFGGIANLALPWDTSATEKDVLRFYLDWNADIEKILGGFKAAFGV